MNTKLISLAVSCALSGFLFKEFLDNQTSTGVLRRLVALWEEKSTNVAIVVLGFTLLLLVIGFVVEKVFVDIKEMERMNLVENTKTKFIEMALFASGMFMNRRVDSFGGLSMLLLVVVICNLHWLSSDRAKEHLAVSRLDGMFLRLMLFKLCFFLLTYAIFHILVNVKGVIFKILWFEVLLAHQVTYIMIKQLRDLVMSTCAYYFQLTGRTGFEISLAGKSIVMVFRSAVFALKLYVFFFHHEVGMIYVGFSDSDLHHHHFALQLLQPADQLHRLPDPQLQAREDSRLRPEGQG